MLFRQSSSQKHTFPQHTPVPPGEKAKREAVLARVKRCCLRLGEESIVPRYQRDVPPTRSNTNPDPNPDANPDPNPDANPDINPDPDPDPDPCRKNGIVIIGAHAFFYMLKEKNLE